MPDLPWAVQLLRSPATQGTTLRCFLSPPDDSMPYQGLCEQTMAFLKLQRLWKAFCDESILAGTYLGQFVADVH